MTTWDSKSLRDKDSNSPIPINEFEIFNFDFELVTPLMPQIDYFGWAEREKLKNWIKGICTFLSKKKSYYIDPNKNWRHRLFKTSSYRFKSKKFQNGTIFRDTKLFI